MMARCPKAPDRYREGYLPYLYQLDAERGLLSTQPALVEALTDQQNATVTLYRSPGGVWQSRMRESDGSGKPISPALEKLPLFTPRTKTTDSRGRSLIPISNKS
jgi:hypothetical protein